MEENRRLDDELADITDAIIEKRAMNTADELDDLSDVVRGLNALIKPGERPSAIFEARMKQRVDQELEQRARRFSRARVNPAGRMAAMAATLVVILIVVILLNRGTPDSTGLPGTAVGAPETIATLVVLAAIAGAGLLIWRNRR